MKTLNQLLTKEYLYFLDKLSYSYGSKINLSASGGQRKSGAKGNSLEFSDFRDYTIGDDTRRIDWNSFARSERLVTKVYNEEKQAIINVFIDTSGSMGVDEKKWELSKLISASISYIALKNNDKVNVYAWNKGLLKHSLNNMSNHSFHKIVTFIDSLEPTGESVLKDTVSQSLKNNFHGASIIVSDMFLTDSFLLATKAFNYKKQTLHFIQVLSEEDKTPTLKGDVRLVDSETKEEKDVTITATLIEQYVKALQQMQDEIMDICKKNGGKFIDINTSMDFKECVKKIFSS